MDQLVNQAAKMRYMSGGKLSVPMTVLTFAGSGRGSGAAALAEPRGLARARPRPLGRLPLEPRRREGPAEDGDPLRGSGRLRRVVAALDDRGEVPEGEHLVPIGKAAIARAGLRRDARLVGLGRRAHAGGGGDPGRRGHRRRGARPAHASSRSTRRRSWSRSAAPAGSSSSTTPPGRSGRARRSPRSSPSTPSTRCARRSPASRRRSRPRRSRTSSSTPTTHARAHRGAAASAVVGEAAVA